MWSGQSCNHAISFCNHSGGQPGSMDSCHHRRFKIIARTWDRPLLRESYSPPGNSLVPIAIFLSLIFVLPITAVTPHWHPKDIPGLAAATFFALVPFLILGAGWFWVIKRVRAQVSGVLAELGNRELARLPSQHYLGGVVKRVCTRSSLPGVGRQPSMMPSSWHSGSPPHAIA